MQQDPGGAGGAVPYVVIRETDMMPMARTETREAAEKELGEMDGWTASEPGGLAVFGIASMTRLFNHLSTTPLARRFDSKEEAAERTWALVLAADLPAKAPEKKVDWDMYKAPKVMVEESSTLIKTPFKEDGTMKTATKVKTTKKGTATKGFKRGATKATGGKSERKPGSGALIRDLIQKGTPTDDILKAVKKAFPDSTAGPSDVSWNRSKLRKDGVKFPEPKE